jgi:hypothetical protein
MENSKTPSETDRFSRYQKVVDLLLTKDGFHKSHIYEHFKDEDRAVIGWPES